MVAISRSSGVDSPLMLRIRLVVEDPLLFSSRSILFIQIVMLTIAFFRVTMLSRSSSSVQLVHSRGMQHLKEILRSFSSPFVIVLTFHFQLCTIILGTFVLIGLSFQKANFETLQATNGHRLNPLGIF